MTINIVGLDHILLAMPPKQEAKARYFYGILLGLTEIEKPEILAGNGGCWFSGQNVVVHLGVQKVDFIPAKKAHPAFVVTDLKSAQKKFEQAGHKVKEDKILLHFRRFFVNDPFGNRIEFIQEADKA